MRLLIIPNARAIAVMAITAAMVKEHHDTAYITDTDRIC